MKCKNCKKEMKQIKTGTQEATIKNFPAPMVFTMPCEEYKCECGTTLKVLGFTFLWKEKCNKQ